MSLEPTQHLLETNFNYISSEQKGYVIVFNLKK